MGLLFFNVAFIAGATLCAVFQSTVAINLDSEALNQALESVQSLVDMFGGLGDCTHGCNDGEVLVPNSSYVHKTNGCGSFGVELSFDDMPQLSMCCNKHDACYEICGIKKADCDSEFKKCTDEVCNDSSYKDGDNFSQEGLAACHSLSDLLYETTAVLGCKPFKSAQKEACVCVKEEL